jgi:hypothetical protein
MRFTDRIVSAYLIPVALLALAGCSGGTANSQTIPTATATPAGQRSLSLEGIGTLFPTSVDCDSGGNCPGNLTATLSGPPFGQLSLNMDLNVIQAAESDNCHLAIGETSLGSGTNPSQASFQGEFCPQSSGYSFILRGTFTVNPQQSCSTTPLMVSGGELIVFGANHTSGPTPPPGSNPIPGYPASGGPTPSGGVTISIIGSTGQIAAPCPSP